MAATTARGYAIHDVAKPNEFKLIEFPLKAAGPFEVDIAIEACGVCGSDKHTASGSWGPVILPCVVGHEVVGRVSHVGESVTEFKVGDLVGVGAQVMSCRTCKQCTSDSEQYCTKKTMTYNDKFENGDVAYGGYANAIRTHESSVFAVPEGMDPKIAAPLMCAGLTMFSPLLRHGAGPGRKVGIVGIGGLGHLGIQLAKAMGAEVYAFTHSLKKEQDLIKMGADHIIVTGGDSKFDEDLAFELDLLISTVDAVDGLPLDRLIKCMTVNGHICTVGLPAGGWLPPIKAFTFLGNGCALSSSLIGSKKEATQMLKLCHEKGVKPWIQEMPMSEAGKAFDALDKGTVRYRTVLINDIPKQA